MDDATERPALNQIKGRIQRPGIFVAAAEGKYLYLRHMWPAEESPVRPSPHQREDEAGQHSKNAAPEGARTACGNLDHIVKRVVDNCTGITVFATPISTDTPASRHITTSRRSVRPRGRSNGRLLRSVSAPSVSNVGETTVGLRRRLLATNCRARRFSGRSSG